YRSSSIGRSMRQTEGPAGFPAKTATDLGGLTTR
ncbi:hypothetical protein PC123_g26301, partial [Phytophthora cactorum]